MVEVKPPGRRGKRVVLAVALLGLAITTTAVVVWYRSLAVKISILPDRAAWRRGERITGRVIVRNDTFNAIALSRYSIIWVFPVNERGDRVGRERWLPLYTSIKLGESMLDPSRGKALEEAFEVRSDPLESQGYLMPPGRYTLTLEPKAIPGDAPLRVHPATVEILPESVNRCGSRIVAFAAGSSGLGIVREDGALECRDLGTGWVLSSGNLDWDLPLETAPWSLRFSPDGSVLAAVRRGEDLSREPWLEIHRFSESGFSRRLRLPVPQLHRRLHTLYSVGAQGGETGRYSVAYGGGIVQVDENGSVECTEGTWINAATSPDGRFMFRIVDEGLEITTRDGAQRRRPLPPGFAGNQLFGKQGYFLGCQKPEQVIFGSYDGQQEKSFPTDAIRPIAETPDGRLVALATIKEKPPVRVQVWHVGESRRLWELIVPDGLETAFSGQPYRLLCAERVKGKAGASWISDEFRVYDGTSGKLLNTLDLSTASQGR